MVYKKQAATDRSETAVADTPEKLDYATLPVVVAERLRELIIEGELEADARLNERALCERLGVSRTPLREALRLLASEGLVQIQPNRGARVVNLSEADIRESFAVLGALEALSGELACQNASDEDITEIAALTYEMQAYHARQDLSSYYKVNRDIHYRITLAAGNELLAQVHEQLNRRVQSLRFRSNLNPDKWARAMQEHIAMAEALRARDGETLGSLMRTHMARKCEAVLENLSASARQLAELPER